MRFINAILMTVVLGLGIARASVPLPEHATESRRVHQLVDAMQSAIDRLDIGAYMALIDPADPVLITEHRAWFADLSAHPVDDLTMDIDADEPIQLDADGSVLATLRIRWQVPSEGKPRAYALPARFEPIGTPNGQWHFVGRAWDVALHDTPGVRVYSDAKHESIARMALERAPILRERIAQDMGVDPAGGNLHEVVVKIFPRMSELQASIYPSYTDPLGGWNEPGESIKILGRDELPQERLDPLLAHEIGHAVSFEFGPEIINAPWWTLERIAEVAAGLFRDSWERKNTRIARMAQRDDLREWNLLADFRGEANNHAMHVYLQGWSMIDYIDRTYSKTTRNAWFTRLAHGETLEQATRAVIGIGFDELDAQWQEELMAVELDADER